MRMLLTRASSNAGIAIVTNVELHGPVPVPSTERARRRAAPAEHSWQKALLIALALSATRCVYARIAYYNTPTLAAPSYFDARAIEPSPLPLVLPEREPRADFGVTEARRKRYDTFDALLSENDTRAFIAIYEDTIVYERYFGGFSRDTLMPSFSISKTYAALLVGCALADGLLPSLREPIVRYVPSLAKKRGYAAIELEELLRMTSGIDFEEASSKTALFYYTDDLRALVGAYEVRWTPGSRYLYGSVNIQLLWEALQATLGSVTVSGYFEARVWQPAGAAHAATWSLDDREHGVEKFFSGLNATARDHALLGLVYLHEGTLNGRTIVPKEWVRESLSPDPVAGVVEITDGAMRRGKYQWFLTMDGRAFFAKGYRGQYVFVIPSRKAVFVRFGEGYGDVDWPALFLRLADAQ
jgi:hypothetical protein